MYQAIVFLPLLGAILAALISLAGARARHPGGAAGGGGSCCALRARPLRMIRPPSRTAGACGAEPRRPRLVARPS